MASKGTPTAYQHVTLWHTKPRGSQVLEQKYKAHTRLYGFRTTVLTLSTYFETAEEAAYAVDMVHSQHVFKVNYRGGKPPRRNFPGGLEAAVAELTRTLQQRDGIPAQEAHTRAREKLEEVAQNVANKLAKRKADLDASKTTTPGAGLADRCGTTSGDTDSSDGRGNSMCAAAVQRPRVAGKAVEAQPCKGGATAQQAQRAVCTGATVDSASLDVRLPCKRVQSMEGAVEDRRPAKKERHGSDVGLETGTATQAPATPSSPAKRLSTAANASKLGPGTALQGHSQNPRLVQVKQQREDVACEQRPHSNMSPRAAIASTKEEGHEGGETVGPVGSNQHSVTQVGMGDLMPHGNSCGSPGEAAQGDVVSNSLSIKDK